jgi:DNA invertase Pin-like site-specific DNA recombinase
MIMEVIAAVAEFERNLLIERTQSGLERAKAQGKADWPTFGSLGCPSRGRSREARRGLSCRRSAPVRDE